MIEMTKNPEGDRLGEETTAMRRPKINRTGSVRENIEKIERAITNKDRARAYAHTTAATHMNFSVLIEQWLVHMCFPISLLYLKKKYGPRASYNQLFDISSGGPFVLIAHLYWILPVLFLVFRKQLNESGITNSEFAVTMMAGAVYRLVVASKYATLTKAEYLRFLTLTSDEEAHEMRTLMQLISGWMSVDIPQCAHESRLAAQRVGLCGEETMPRFTLPVRDLISGDSNAEGRGSWASLLGEKFVSILTDGFLHLHQPTSAECLSSLSSPVRDHIKVIGSSDEDDEKRRVMETDDIDDIFHFAMHHHYPSDTMVDVDMTDFLAIVAAHSNPVKLVWWMNRFTAVVIIICSILPHIARASCPALSRLISSNDLNDNDKKVEVCTSGAFFGNGGLANFISGLLLFLNAMFFLPLALFFQTLVVSNLRHWKMCKIFGLIIRVDVMSPSMSEIPVLDTQQVGNVRAWMMSFLTINHFGFRYKFRMELYSRVCAVLLISLLLWIYLHAYALTSAKENSSDDSGDDEDSSSRISSGVNPIVLDVRFFYSILLLFLWGGYFATVIAIIAATNEEIALQEMHWLTHRLRVRDQRYHKRHFENLILTDEKNEDMLKAVEKEVLSVEYFNQLKSDINIKPQLEQQEQEKKQNRPHELEFSKQNSFHSSANDGVTPKGISNSAQEKINGIEVYAHNEELDDLMEAAAQVIETQCRISPIRFLGLPGCWGLLGSYCAIWGALIAITLSVAGINYDPTEA